MFSLREKRVEKLWTKARRLAFDHSFTTLIHPLPTLRRADKGVDGRRFQQLLFLVNKDLKNRSRS